MREIKFRVWSKHTEKMFDDGFYISQDSDLFQNDSLDYKSKDLYEVMQYTGLKDKNGKEIYEGDIVKNAFGEEYKIIWDEKRCQFIAVTTIEDGSEWYQNVSRRLEVIGNIYENSTK